MVPKNITHFLDKTTNGSWLRAKLFSNYLFDMWHWTDGYSLLPLASEVFMSDWKLFSLYQTLEKHFTVWDFLLVEDGSEINFEQMESPGSIFQI